MSMPRSVRLLTQRIDVKVAPHLHHQTEPNEFGETYNHRAYGIYEEATQTITLDKGLAFERARETFLHENLHAILSISGLNEVIPMEAEEHVVGVLAPVMLAWMRDNPRVVNWLTEVQS